MPASGGTQASPFGAPKRSGSLRAQIYGDLRARLQRGEVGPSERLVDLDIAATLGVSRMPVREALLQLTHEGYLTSTTRGFVVPTLTPDDIAEIFEIRRLIEPRAAANAARDMSAAVERRLEAAVRLAHEADAAADVGRFMTCNAGFRQAWLDAVRNRRLAATIERFVDHVQAVRFGTLGDPATRRIVLTGLERLADAFRRRDPVAAHDRMADFITQAEAAFFRGHADAAAAAAEPDAAAPQGGAR